jgi:uncharacterized protein involved in exopolysaccharide biosynthesis
MAAADQLDSRDPMDLFATLSLVWGKRWVVIGITSAFVVAGVAYAFLAQEKYRAEVIMSSSGQRSVPGGGALNQLGGLAALAGVTIGSNNLAIPIAVLQSSGLTREFIEEMKIEPVLLDGNADDDKDIRDAVMVFDRSVRSVYEDKKTGVVTLTIEWTDATVAADWANALVAKVNMQLRQQALEEAERNVDYLTREMAKTDVVSQQQSIGRVLESEMQKLILARGNEEFAFRILDRATPPKNRSSPKRAVIVLLSGVLGLIASVVFLLGRREWSLRSSRPIPPKE